MKSFKKVLAYALAATLALGSCTTAFAAASNDTGNLPVKQKNETVTQKNGNQLKVDTTKGGNAGIGKPHPGNVVRHPDALCRQSPEGANGNWVAGCDNGCGQAAPF